MFDNVHAIGDSHVLHMGGLFHVHHICDEKLQGATAHNLIEKESTTDSRRKLGEALDLLKDSDVALLSFGEVDCRLHIRDMDMLADTVARYTAVLDELGDNIIVHEVIGAVPQDNSFRDANYPDAKTRGEFVMAFNDALRDYCYERGVPFLELGISENGVLPDDWTDDGVHLIDEKAYPLYVDWFEGHGYKQNKVSLAVWSTRAMVTHSERIAKVLGARLFLECPVGDVDECLIVGMFDPPFYHTTLKHTSRAKKRHIHWCGTDVLLLTHPEFLPEATHSCSGEQLSRELFEHGIEAENIWTPTARRFEVRPLPPEKRVGVYLGADARKYGASAVAAVIEAMPDHEFFIYQLGQFDDMQPVFDSCRVYLRLTRHDGDCASAREFMEAGRRAVITADLPYAKKVKSDDLVGIVRAIRKATSYEEPDYEAAAFYRAANSDEAYREAMSCQLQR